LNGLEGTNLNLSRSTNSGSSWITVPRNSFVAGSGTYTIVGTGINAFSDWTLEGGNGPLPVSFLYFNGVNAANGNVLTWATGSEINNRFFTLERSVDGKNFIKVTTIAGNGTVNNKSTYSYTDTYGAAYYRLSQTDFDGTTATLSTIYVNSTAVIEAGISPNPATSSASLFITGVADNAPISLVVNTVTGKTIAQVTGTSLEIENAFEKLSGNLASGTYFVQVIADSKVKTIKFIKR